VRPAPRARPSVTDAVARAPQGASIADYPPRRAAPSPLACRGGTGPEHHLAAARRGNGEARLEHRPSSRKPSAARLSGTHDHHRRCSWLPGAGFARPGMTTYESGRFGPRTTEGASTLRHCLLAASLPSRRARQGQLRGRCAAPAEPAALTLLRSARPNLAAKEEWRGAQRFSASRVGMRSPMFARPGMALRRPRRAFPLPDPHARARPRRAGPSRRAAKRGCR
jgi:hypothetical protein